MTSPRQHPTAWDAVADLLAAIGVDVIFGLPGDDLRLLSALATRPVRLVICRDQRNAVFMATGYALASGRPGVCVVGKGPAVTNAATGLLEAASGRVPLVLLADGTATPRVGTGAFQELDQIAAVRPLTKWAVRVEEPERVCPVLDKAVLVATTGAPGPVYVEIPEPVAAAPVVQPTAWHGLPVHRPAPGEETLTASYQRLRAARRPLLLVGGGARHRNPDRRIERLAEVLGAGIATTASGRGTVDETHPLFCGLSGLYAVSPLGELWHETDLVVALGSRLEETATFGWPEPSALPVLQVTLGESDFVAERPGAKVFADVGETVAGWLRCAQAHAPTADAAWSARIDRAKHRALQTASAAAAGADDRVSMAALLAAVRETAPPGTVTVHENGLQDMWSYFFPHFVLPAAGPVVPGPVVPRAVVPSEQTSLGFGAAAAVGVACAVDGGPVLALVGDGAFHLFAAELPTVAHTGVAVVYVVLDNGGYGWLQANHTDADASRFTFLTGRAAGMAAQVQAYGLHYTRVDEASSVRPALRQAWQQRAAGVSTVIHVPVDIRDVPPGMEELAGDFPTSQG